MRGYLSYQTSQYSSNRSSAQKVIATKMYISFSWRLPWRPLSSPYPNISQLEDRSQYRLPGSGAHKGWQGLSQPGSPGISNQSPTEFRGERMSWENLPPPYCFLLNSLKWEKKKASIVERRKWKAQSPLCLPQAAIKPVYPVSLLKALYQPDFCHWLFPPWKHSCCLSTTTLVLWMA